MNSIVNWRLGKKVSYDSVSLLTTLQSIDFKISSQNYCFFQPWKWLNKNMVILTIINYKHFLISLPVQMEQEPREMPLDKSTPGWRFLILGTLWPGNKHEWSFSLQIHLIWFNQNLNFICYGTVFFFFLQNTLRNAPIETRKVGVKPISWYLCTMPVLCLLSLVQYVARTH